jgi:fructose/tagatose bisphosphate aldolase
MPLITDRQAVLDVYAAAAERRWVLPCFNSENLTTTEAILAAAADFGRQTGRADVPISIGLTNLYPARPQACCYTHTRDWRVGVELFLADLAVLTGRGSPFAELNVLVALDHGQWDLDAELLGGDLSRFSVVMFDASGLPMEENLRQTAAFVDARGTEVVIEGACDEIADASGAERMALTTPSAAVRFFRETGVDLVVANLGTEHRASAAECRYHGELARAISAQTGAKLVLHGTSSVAPEQVASLYADGICKVNLWTTLERDSAPAMLEALLTRAAKVAGPERARQWQGAGLLGPAADTTSRPDLGSFATVYRQQIVFEAMKEIVHSYLRLWYT